MVATYAALLYVLFGKKCHLYEQVLKIYKVLNQDEEFANRLAFHALKCKQIMWAIFDDSHSFFWKKVSPMNLVEGKTIEGIRSMLDDVIPDVRFARNVVRSTFPLAWQDKTNVYIPPSGLPPAPMLHMQQQFQGPQPFLSPYSGVVGTALGVPPPPPPPRETLSLATKLMHVAQATKNKFQEYHKKYGGRVLLLRLLQLGNIKITKLPVVPELVDATGKNNWCYNYCLGVCPHGENCHYKKLGGHVNGDKLPAAFVANLCQVIEPGIAAAMKLSPARPSDGKQGPREKRTKFT